MIKLVRPPITFEEVEPALREIFSSGWFTKGQNVAALREAIVRETGAQYAHLTTSATTALWTAVKLLGIGPGDEVIVSDFSFPASGNVVEDLGARPVYADVDPAGWL